MRVIVIAALCGLSLGACSGSGYYAYDPTSPAGRQADRVASAKAAEVAGRVDTRKLYDTFDAQAGGDAGSQ